MKHPLTKVLSLACALLAAKASAFTLDFSALTVSARLPESPGGLALAVAGYGAVELRGAAGAAATPDPRKFPNAVNFEHGETLKVTFLDDPLQTDPRVGDAIAGGGGGLTLAGRTLNVYEVKYPGSNGAVSAVHVVPEPSALWLGGLGLLALLRRRRIPGLPVATRG